MDFLDDFRISIKAFLDLALMDFKNKESGGKTPEICPGALAAAIRNVDDVVFLLRLIAISEYGHVGKDPHIFLTLIQDICEALPTFHPAATAAEKASILRELGHSVNVQDAAERLDGFLNSRREIEVKLDGLDEIVRCFNNYHKDELQELRLNREILKTETDPETESGDDRRKRIRRTPGDIRPDRSKSELALAVLRRHHRYGTDNFNYRPLTTTEFKALTDGPAVSEATVRRRVDGWFTNWKGYLIACEDRTIEPKLELLSGDRDPCALLQLLNPSTAEQTE